MGVPQRIPPIQLPCHQPIAGYWSCCWLASRLLDLTCFNHSRSVTFPFGWLFNICWQWLTLNQQPLAMLVFVESWSFMAWACHCWPLPCYHILTLAVASPYHCWLIQRCFPDVFHSCLPAYGQTLEAFWVPNDHQTFACAGRGASPVGWLTWHGQGQGKPIYFKIYNKHTHTHLCMYIYCTTCTVYLSLAWTTDYSPNLLIGEDQKMHHGILTSSSMNR